MSKPRGKTLKQLSGEAARYAEFYFDRANQVRMWEDAGCPVDADYAVLAMNRFIPIDWVPASAAMLRKFVRGGTSGFDESENDALKEYWRELEAVTATLSTAFEAGEPTAAVKATARGQPTWPAVGVADSEVDMRALLMEQFELLRLHRVEWQCVDSSTCPHPKPDGIYVVVDWFWHGM